VEPTAGGSGLSHCPASNQCNPASACAVYYGCAPLASTGNGCRGW
jgi:hypothetical protein